MLVSRSNRVGRGRLGSPFFIFIFFFPRYPQLYLSITLFLVTFHFSSMYGREECRHFRPVDMLTFTTIFFLFNILYPCPPLPSGPLYSSRAIRRMLCVFVLLESFERMDIYEFPPPDYFSLLHHSSSFLRQEGREMFICFIVKNPGVFFYVC